MDALTERQFEAPFPPYDARWTLPGSGCGASLLGHEIPRHCRDPAPIDRQSPVDFRAATVLAKERLKQAAVAQVLGYRGSHAGTAHRLDALADAAQFVAGLAEGPLPRGR